MFTLKYKDIRDPHFAEGIYKLINYNAFPTTVCIAIAKMKKAIEEKSEAAKRDYEVLLKQFAEVDGNNELVPLENNPNAVKIPQEKQAGWMKANEEFNEREFQIDREKIALRTLDGVQLSPQNFLALECILNEDVPEPTTLKSVPN